MRPLVVAVGDPLRGDDGVGPAVLALLGREEPLDADLEVVRVPARLPSLWEGRELVVVVDAVRGRDPAGTVVRVEPGAGAGPRLFGSTHGFGVGEVVALSLAMGSAPPALRLLGVTGRRWGLGEEMSAEVTGSVPVVAAEVRRIIVERTSMPVPGGEPVRRGRD